MEHHPGKLPSRRQPSADRKPYTLRTLRPWVEESLTRSGHKLPLFRVGSGARAATPAHNMLVGWEGLCSACYLSYRGIAKPERLLRCFVTLCPANYSMNVPPCACCSINSRVEVNFISTSIC